MIDERVALVTGGSRGIGRAICVALAEAGFRVYINYTANKGAADSVVSECLEYGKGGASALQFDVGSKEEVEKAINTIKEESGRLDVLVNNAGISHNALLLRTKDEDWHKVLDINLTGAFLCSRAALKLLLKSTSGRIVNVSSVVGEMGNPGQVAYVASKAGVLGLTKALAKELGSRQITVNAITPGFIDTDMTKYMDENQRIHYLNGIPLQSFGTPEDVAAAVKFLSSSDAKYITGQVLGVNGGLYM
jgi:3-oxoacyl-[acyl-carrier protein] reductase